MNNSITSWSTSSRLTSFRSTIFLIDSFECCVSFVPYSSGCLWMIVKEWSSNAIFLALISHIRSSRVRSWICESEYATFLLITVKLETLKNKITIKIIETYLPCYDYEHFLVLEIF